jgi:micrococcal nuclease
MTDVYHAGRWINLEMVKEGWAWHYKAYSDNKQLAEVAARKIRRGLWADPSPVPPWEYRNPKKSTRPITG